MRSIAFHNADIDQRLKHVKALKDWISRCLFALEKHQYELTYVFCSDEYLLNVNKSFLDHDFYTDIITFDLSEQNDALIGEICISRDRVKDNAKSFGVTINDELQRVMIHGVLHLCGWNDHSEGEKALMRQKENELMELFHVEQ